MLLEGMLVVYSRQNSLLLKNINRNTGSVVRNYPNARIKRNILLQSYFLFLIVQQKFLVFFKFVKCVCKNRVEQSEMSRNK